LVSDKVPNKDKFSRGPSGSSIMYNGKSTQRTRLIVLCDRADDIDGAISQFEYNTKYELSADDCGFEKGTQTVCIVAVIPDT
jgi:hypothetical protein